MTADGMPDAESERALAALIACTTPVVLVGGRSRRFGQDKLRHELATGEMLVERAINALREVFGPRVAGVGACDERVAARFDTMIHDPRPGLGPMAGLLAALDATGGAVFLLAGDLPEIRADDVRAILRHGARDPTGRTWDAIVARSERIEPTIGLYHAACAGIARRAIEEQRPAMRELLALVRVAEVSLTPGRCRNVNTRADLARERGA